MSTETRAHYWRTHRARERQAVRDPSLNALGDTFPCAVEQFVIRRLKLKPMRMWAASCDARGSDGLRYEIRSRAAGSKRAFKRLNPSEFDRMVVCDWTRRHGPVGPVSIHVDCRIVEASEVRKSCLRLNGLLNAKSIRLRGRLMF